jgi:leucyl aminopeptidase
MNNNNTQDSIHLSNENIIFSHEKDNAINTIVAFVDKDKNLLGNCDSSWSSLIGPEFAEKTKYQVYKRVDASNNLLNNIIIINAANLKEEDSCDIRNLGALIYKAILENGAEKALVISDYFNAEQNYFFALGALLSSYRFTKYKTKDEDKIKSKIKTLVLTFCLNEASVAKKAHDLFMQEGCAIAKGTFFARDCVNLAPNHLYPESYAQKIQGAFKGIDNVEVKVFNEKQMQDLGMGALLGVGQGSVKESKMVIVEYKGASSEEKPIAYVGKGVTFDTGGISLKPASKMDEMKYDMSGSAAVIGALLALSLRKEKVNVIGAVGLVENMIGDNAQRPGDIVTTMSGKTVEVLNTDAEGRLVLADVLWYVQQNFAPKLMIDIATLTGAIIIALGNTYAGCFSQDQQLVNQLKQAGKSTGEEIWHLPLHKDYDEVIKSHFADLANISSKGGAAGSSTAAQFLQHFTNNITWAHLDVAGVSNYKDGKEGFGVLLLNEFAKFYLT